MRALWRQLAPRTGNGPGGGYRARRRRRRRGRGRRRGARWELSLGPSAFGLRVAAAVARRAALAGAAEPTAGNRVPAPIAVTRPAAGSERLPRPASFRSRGDVPGQAAVASGVMPPWLRRKPRSRAAVLWSPGKRALRGTGGLGRSGAEARGRPGEGGRAEVAAGVWWLIPSLRRSGRQCARLEWRSLAPVRWRRAGQPLCWRNPGLVQSR